MAFTAFPIPTATILQHATVGVDPAADYLLVQKANGVTGKISVLNLFIAVGVPPFSSVSAVNAATVTSQMLIIYSDANGDAGIFTKDGASGTADGVNLVDDLAGTKFRRLHLI